MTGLVRVAEVEARRRVALAELLRGTAFGVLVANDPMAAVWRRYRILYLNLQSCRIFNPSRSSPLALIEPVDPETRAFCRRFSAALRELRQKGVTLDGLKPETLPHGNLPRQVKDVFVRYFPDALDERPVGVRRQPQCARAVPIKAPNQSVKTEFSHIPEPDLGGVAKRLGDRPQRRGQLPHRPEKQSFHAAKPRRRHRSVKP